MIIILGTMFLCVQVGTYLPHVASQQARGGYCLLWLATERVGSYYIIFVPLSPQYFRTPRSPHSTSHVCVIPSPAETVLPNIKQEISTIINDGMVARQLATHLSLINHTNKQEVKWKQGRFQAIRLSMCCDYENGQTTHRPPVAVTSQLASSQLLGTLANAKEASQQKTLVTLSGFCLCVRGRVGGLNESVKLPGVY